MRNKEQSDAITSGQHGPKLPGLGRAPTSGVCGLWPQRHCLPLLFANNIRILYTMIYFYYHSRNKYINYLHIST